MTQAAVAINWTQGETGIFRLRPPLKVSEYAQRYRVVLSGELRGQWKNESAPYLVKPMDTWQLPHVQEVTLRFAPQSGKTQAALNCLLYAIDYDQGPAFYIMPDETVAKRISRRQIIPAIRTTPPVAALLGHRASAAATMSIRFINGMDVTLGWATSAASIASESYRYLFIDEPEKYPAMAGREGDPIYLAEMRTIAYPYTRKIFYYSTPDREDGTIMRCEAAADEHWQYQAKCPFCGHEQIMIFDRIVWPKGIDPKTLRRKRLARYQCENCGMDWDDHTRTAAVLKSYREGEHQGWTCDHQVERPQHVSFHLPAWYSRFVSMSDCGADFLRGQGDPGRLKMFVTQRKADPWKEIVVKTDQAELLKARCDLPAQTVPENAIALSMGVDVQKYGFWFVVRAWAPDFTSWLIHYGHLAKWADVERVLFETSYPVAGTDRRMGIWRAAVDTGGGQKYEDLSMTEETYWWIRVNGVGRGPRVWGTKGSSRPLAGKLSVGKPLDKTPSGKPLPGGLVLVSLDTDKIKDMVHYRLDQAAKQESFAAYLHADTGVDYAGQLTAEEKQRDKKGVETWVQVRKDNHLLDCECLAQIVVDPEWPGGGLNLLRPAQPTTPADTPKPVRKWVDPPKRKWV